MRYIRVFWIGAPHGEPYELWSEIDDSFWEIRKVEFFRDGRKGYADSTSEFGSTSLGLIFLPSLESIANDPQFRIVVITKNEFKQVWNEARQASHSEVVN